MKTKATKATQATKTYFLFTKAMSKWVVNSRLSFEGLTQGKVAKDLGVLQGFLSAVETGKTKKIEQSKWASMQEYFTKKGVAPLEASLDPSRSAVNPKDIVKALQALKKSTGSSWDQVSAELGVHKTTMQQLISGRQVGPATLNKMSEAISSLKALPGKLKAEGHVSSEKVVKKDKPKKKSIIENVEIPTELALAMEKLKAIAVLEKYVPTHGNFMNGGARKLLHG